MPQRSNVNLLPIIQDGMIRQSAFFLAALDTEVTAGDQKGKTIQGIYEIDGDTLRVCVVLPGKGERPTEFSGKGGSGCNLTVYERQKK